MKAAWLSVGSTCVCLLLTASAMATDVSGSVDLATVRPQAADETARAYYWDEPNGALPPAEDSTRAHDDVCLVVLGKGRPESLRYAFEGGTLSPRTIALRSGSSVSIVNTDIFSHQLFSPGLSELEPLATAPGHLRKVTLGKVGVFELRDQLHPSTVAHAHVISDLLLQVPLKPSGDFEFEIDPGTYTLKVLRAGEVVYEKSVKVSGKKSSLGKLKLKALKKN